MPPTYAGLVAPHPPRLILDDFVYDNAVEVFQALAGPKLKRHPDLEPEPTEW